MPSRSLKCFLLVILAAMFAVSAQAQVKSLSDEFSPPPMAPNLAVSEWKRFASDVGRFSVLLPTKPEEDQAANAGAKAYFFHSFLGQFDFKLKYIEMPTAPDPQKMFDTLLAGTKAAKGVKLVGEKVVEVNGHPGREFAVETEMAFTQTKVIIAGNHIYQLVVMSLNKKSETKEARAFLDSFKITDASGEKKAQPNNSKPY